MIRTDDSDSTSAAALNGPAGPFMKVNIAAWGMYVKMNIGTRTPMLNNAHGIMRSRTGGQSCG